MDDRFSAISGSAQTLLITLTGVLGVCLVLWFRQVRRLKLQVSLLERQLDREDHQARHDQSRWVRRWRKAQTRARKARRWQKHLRLATREGGLYFFRLDVTTTRLRWYGPKASTAPLGGDPTQAATDTPSETTRPTTLPDSSVVHVGELGLPRQCSLDAFVQDHVHLEDRALIHGLLMQARHHGQVPATPLRLIDRHGTLYWGQIWGRPGQGGKARCRHVLGVLRLTQEG